MAQESPCQGKTRCKGKHYGLACAIGTKTKDTASLISNPVVLDGSDAIMSCTWACEPIILCRITKKQHLPSSTMQDLAIEPLSKSTDLVSLSKSCTPKLKVQMFLSCPLLAAQQCSDSFD